MSYELKTLESGQALYLRVVDAPSLDEAQALNEEIAAEVDRHDLTRMIVDYRDMESCALDASAARVSLLRLERLLAELRRTPAEALRIALLSAEGTFGHGIARMTAGNAYGLRVMTLKHFTDCAAARVWLDLSAGPGLSTPLRETPRSSI